MKNEKDIFSRWLAVISIALSLFAIFQTYHHDQISIKPKLTFIMDPGDSGPLAGLSVENDGLGPAIIKSVSKFVDRKPAKDWDQVVDYCHIKNPDPIDWWNLSDDDTFRVGQTEELLFRSTKNKKGLDEFVECIDNHLAVSITYCSLDGECQTKCSDDGRCK